MKYILVAAGVALISGPVLSQDAMPLPVQRIDAAPSGNAVLPANTEIILEMNQDVTTKGKTWSEGDQFKLTVADDVILGDYVVIPEGTPAFGRITWLTNKGAFGKSGKMDVELEYLELAGRRIKLDGTYRQEGEGNTLATVGGVVAAGPFAAFITGKSGLIPAGRELTATLEDDLELAIPASAISQPRNVAPIARPGQVAAEVPVPAVADETAEAESDQGEPEFVSEPVEQPIED